MALMLFKAILVWCVIAVAEILRVRLLNRRVGDHRARQVVRPAAFSAPHLDWSRWAFDWLPVAGH
jgi:hypothetical protein